jgi:hypothetical protein
MAQTSRDFREVLRRSLCAAAASVAVGEDGLDRIWIRLARPRSRAAADDREIAVRGVRSARAGKPSAGRGHSGRLSTQKIRPVRGLDPACRQLNQTLPVERGRRYGGKGRPPKPCA